MIASIVAHDIDRSATESPVANTGLSELLGEREGDFVTHYWPDRFYLTHGPVERLRCVFPLGLDEILALPCSGINAFIPLDNGVTESLYVGHGQVLQLYRAGFTLYFHDLRSPAFEPFVSAIEERLGLCGGRTRVSAFASSRGSGVATHYDINDNFVIQLNGRKRWRLARNRSAVNPTVGYRVDRSPTPIQLMEADGHLPSRLPDEHTVFDMQPGSVAYVPRGYLHQCETLDEASLHVNVQTAMLTMSDLMAYVFTSKLSPAAPELRVRLSHAFHQGKLSDSIQENLRAEFRRLGEQIREVDLVICESALKTFLQKWRASLNDGSL
jgi:50S ribosomal protein L16 3-hydroxylase